MAGTPQSDTQRDVTEPVADETGPSGNGLSAQYLELTRPPSAVSDRYQVAQVGGDLVQSPTNGSRLIKQERLNEFGQYSYNQDSSGYTLRFEGERRDFNFTLSRGGGPKDIELQEKGQTDKQKFLPPFESKSRENLYFAANREIKDIGLNSKFLADMIRFERRASESGLTPKQVSETYTQIQRILSAGSGDLHGVTSQQRILLAQQTMAQIADPLLAQQAAVTCAPTVAEILLNARHPERSSKFIADLVTNGNFKAPNGTLVNLDKDAFQNSGGSERNPPSIKDRSLFTQVFTAHSLDLMLNHEQKHQIYKESFRDGAFHFELLSTKPSISKVEQFNGLSNDRTGLIYNMIAGLEKGKEMISLDFSDNSRERTETFSNFDQFQDILKKVAQNKSLPIGFGVNTGMRPLWNGKDSADQTGGHILVVSNVKLGKDGNPEQITFYNQGAVQERQFQTVSARQAFEMTSPNAYIKSSIESLRRAHPDWTDTQLKFGSVERLSNESAIKPAGFELTNLMREIISSSQALQPELLPSHEKLYQASPANEKLSYLYYQGPYGPDQGKFYERLGKIITDNNIRAGDIKSALENFDFNANNPKDLPTHVARVIKRALVGASPEAQRILDGMLGR